MQAASYLQAHGGWDQQSLGHPPTRTAKVPAALAADYAAKRIAHPPSGSGWSCTGWGPLLSPGIALVRKWVPATQTSSIWSLSDQPATQKRVKRINRAQSCCFKIHSAPSREHANHDGRAEKFWDETKLSNKLKQIFILQITESPQHAPGAYVVSLT